MNNGARLIREVLRLRELLEKARAEKRAVQEELKNARVREQLVRAENERLRLRLQSAGVDEPTGAPVARRGFCTVNDDLRARIRALKAAGKNNSQTARLVGCSAATVSLIVRGKYPVSRRTPAGVQAPASL